MNQVSKLCREESPSNLEVHPLTIAYSETNRSSGRYQRTNKKI
jgi:hypothetical protein